MKKIIRNSYKDVIEIISELCLDEDSSMIITIVATLTSFIVGLLVIAAVVFYFFRKQTLQIKNIENNKCTAENIVEIQSQTTRKIEIDKLVLGDVYNPTMMEFEKLNSQERLRNNFTSILGGLKENETRNLKKSIVPYDHTRVKLKSDKKTKGYINASWVYLPEDEGDYDSIITLPYLPLSKIGIIVSNTHYQPYSNAHYQMIYENDVNISVRISCIKMIRKGTKLNNPESENGEDLVNRILISRESIDRYICREVWDLSVDRCQTNRLVHFVVTDFSIKSKQATEQLLNTITYLRKEMNKAQSKMVMSVQDEKNGVSEAAVFVTLINLLEQIDEALIKRSKTGDRSIDIYKTVNDLRSKRMQMVHKFEEYDFIFKAVVYYAKHKERYDHMLASKVTTNLSYEQNHQISRHSICEEDDIYLTSQVNVQHILKAQRNRTKYL